MQQLSFILYACHFNVKPDYEAFDAILGFDYDNDIIFICVFFSVAFAVFMFSHYFLNLCLKS